jgi:hypothetical protein
MRAPDRGAAADIRRWCMRARRYRERDALGMHWQKDDIELAIIILAFSMVPVISLLVGKTISWRGLGIGTAFVADRKANPTEFWTTVAIYGAITAFMLVELGPVLVKDFLRSTVSN